MEVQWVERGEAAPFGASSIRLHRLGDGRVWVEGALHHGADRILFVDAMCDSSSAAEAAALTWARGRDVPAVCIARLDRRREPPGET